MATSAFSIGLQDVTLRRHAGITCHELRAIDGDAIHRISVAVPASYEASSKRRYPLMLLLNACTVFGSAAEMSRLMAQTREIEECILVCLETPVETDADLRRHGRFITGQLLAWCREICRVAAGPAVVFSGRAGIVEALACGAEAVALKALPIESGEWDEIYPIPAMVSGLRQHFGTGHQYGSEMLFLGNPLVSKILGALRPLIGRLQSRKAAASTAQNPYVMRAQRMNRDFEIFAVPPESASASPSRRYPTLLVLDANIELSTVAEAAACLARRGEIEEVMVIGIGIPRAEGMIAFGYRRFEEFSPPQDGYRFDDRLGRVFRSLFALRGSDARQCVGKADGLYGFVVDELLPMLVRDLPIDENRLGILGHSAGGAFVGYTLLQERSPFRNYIAISPGVGMSGSWLMREPQSSGPLAHAARHVFFSVGGDEISNQFCGIAGIPRTEALAHQVQRQEQGLAVECKCFDGETHSTIYARSVVQALRAIFSIEASRQ